MGSAIMKHYEAAGMSEDSTKAQYLAYATRWRAVNEYELAEMRDTPLLRKLEQLASLMVSVELFRRDGGSEEDSETWARWNQLREAYRD